MFYCKTLDGGIWIWLGACFIVWLC